MVLQQCVTTEFQRKTLVSIKMAPDAKLQDCFSSTDWNMFRDSSDGIEKYTTSVIGFINKCIDDVVPTVTVRTYTNQNLWKHSQELPSDTSLLDELNYLYARFESNNTETCMIAPAVPEDCVITADVSNTFKQVNIHKAAGPDGLPGRAMHVLTNLQVSSLTSSTCPCLSL